ncbi:preprotein translocase subunit SecY [Lactobacillus acetotolerans]|mgnify:FL=1|uniref:Protein translocase subunit SecY n=2 Tax=Lactobacillus acetotolerans TaxID=1600 RepID=A0A356VPM2_9LACO|nr:preprotein translocase subunit SecY [Lactobacillus acetotolerans]KRN42179.1 preprotein translocase subunit SecY [Lactobacillus acetotolerans DSM 20749 = JCM 3825]QFG50873.1 preprotein translocase subunit SecY [Lactobacillus acetotolerans]QGV05025.1 preprotein translocase subunit SecY [Lactobacillus acetotolerans]QJD72528.1 preprotein translocase subunit SecY [Lactobacillus acetotolerans]GGV07278.1 protein translocase subunit SecY [Lactobacillus acetotolerans DSM 20749 = JCM 3825]
MFSTLKNAFKDKEIRNKIYFTLFILLLYRIGANIIVPGVNAKAITQVAQTGLVPMLDTVSGGGLDNYSIFSLGVSPYITAQIVIQLLQMDIVPTLVEWGKQGEVGRRKTNQVTRWLTLFVAFVQSIGITLGFNALTQMGLVKTQTPQTYIEIAVIMTAGTMLLSWLGDEITDKGLGNGISVIIFAGIIARLPAGLWQVFKEGVINNSSSDRWQGILFFIAIIVAILIVTQLVTWVEQADRRIPIQYTRRATVSGSESFLPLKVNVSGVIPVIFASSFIITPATILMAFQKSQGDQQWFKVLTNIFSLQTTPGVIIYTLLIILFTFFYAFVQVNPEKLAKNLQKQGAYIPSIWPGKDTQDYISKLLIRLSTVGSVFLGLVALLPQLATNFWNLPSSIGLGGTSLLIVIGVVLELSRQINGLLMKREYVGFIR